MTYHIDEARKAILLIIENTAFGSICRKDAIRYLTGETDVRPRETWGFDDEWNQWGNPDLDEAEDYLDLENGYLMGLTDEQRRERISVAEELRHRLQTEEDAAFIEEMTRYENKLIDKGRTEAAKAFEKLNLKPITKEIEATRKDLADIGDTMCGIAGEERIPPEPKEVDTISRRNLYESINRTHKKRGYLETFLDKSTWRFRGFTAKEIYKDADGLRKFMNAERMAITREKSTER